MVVVNECWYCASCRQTTTFVIKRVAALKKLFVAWCGSGSGGGYQKATTRHSWVRRTCRGCNTAGSEELVDAVAIQLLPNVEAMWKSLSNLWESHQRAGNICEFGYPKRIRFLDSLLISPQPFKVYMCCSVIYIYMCCLFALIVFCIFLRFLSTTGVLTLRLLYSLTL